MFDGPHGRGDRRSAPLATSTLVGNRGLEMASICLSSFRHFCRDRTRLFLFGDRDAQETAISPLLERLAPQTQWVPAPEMDDHVAPLLAQHPNCRRYRTEHVFARKLIDIPLYHSSTDWAYVDSDILFIKPFYGLRREGVSERLVGMRDHTDSASIRYYTRYWSRERIALIGWFNAGMLYAAQGAYDLDFVEWFLSRAHYRSQPWLVEQTCWAAMAVRAGGSLWDERQVCFPDRGGQGVIALHYVLPMRHLFAARPQQTETAHADVLMTVRGRVTPLAVATWHRARRRFTSP